MTMEATPTTSERCIGLAGGSVACGARRCGAVGGAGAVGWVDGSGRAAGTAPGPVPRSCMLYTLTATSRAPPRKSTRLSTEWAMATASCPFLLRRMLSPIDGPAAQRARGRPAVKWTAGCSSLRARSHAPTGGDGTAEGARRKAGLNSGVNDSCGLPFVRAAAAR